MRHGGVRAAVPGCQHCSLQSAVCTVQWLSIDWSHEWRPLTDIADTDCRTRGCCSNWSMTATDTVSINAVCRLTVAFSKTEMLRPFLFEFSDSKFSQKYSNRAYAVRHRLFSDRKVRDLEWPLIVIQDVLCTAGLSPDASASLAYINVPLSSIDYIHFNSV